MKLDRRMPFERRQYLLEKDFELFYYNDLHFTPVGRHAHEHYELYFFMNGDVSMALEGKETRLSEGDLIIVPPGTFHQAILHGSRIPYQRFVFWITPDYIRTFQSEHEEYGYVFTHAAKEGKYIYHFDRIAFQALLSVLFDLIDELNSARFGKEAMIHLLFGNLLLSLNRSIYEMENPVNITEEKNLYRSIERYVEDHLSEDLTLDRIAGEFFVSKFYISHLFKDMSGLSLHQYIVKKRLDACRSAIRSGADITKACREMGFKDYSTFYRAFQKEYGMSPKQYRELGASK